MEKDDRRPMEPSGANSIALKELTDLQMFIDLCWEGLGYPQLATLIHDKFGKYVKDDVDEEQKVERQGRLKKLEEYASSQSENGFPYLYGLATVRLWTILEVFIQDIVIWTISNNSEVRDFPVIRKLKGPLLEFVNASQQKKSEYILDLLYEVLSVRLQRGVGRLEVILNAVELGGAIDDRVRKMIFELSEIRNIIAHRNGMAD